MVAMGMAYLELLQDPDLLQVQLHGFVAAAADPDIASACQDTFRRLWHLADAATHAEPAVMREFFAQGMLCNVLAAIDLRSVEEPWAQSFFDGEEAKHEAVLAMGGLAPRPRLRPAPARRREHRTMPTFLAATLSPAKLVTTHNLATASLLPSSD